jgi:diaminopimelate decarboxylase
MLSNRDLDRFAAHGVHMNLDTRSALRRWAATSGAARGVGLRVNPAVRAGWGDDPRLAYGDLVALYPAGAYGASMASDHCMRGLPVEVLV